MEDSQYCSSHQSQPVALRHQSVLPLLCLVALSTIASGCVSQPLLDAPLCPERDFVLQSVSVEDQGLLIEAQPQAFQALADNDLILKSYIRELESMIEAHDEPLGGCDQT